MKSSKILVLLVAVLLALSTMACFITDIVSNVTGGGGDGVTGGEVTRSEGGGYEYVAPSDYENSEAYGYAELIAPGGDIDNGPAFILIGGITEDNQTNEDLVANMQDTLSEGKFSQPKKIKVDGVDGLSITVSDLEDGAEGQIVVVMVTPTQQFLMIGMAPDGEWKTVKKDFETVLKSVRFFEPSLDYYEEYATDVPYTELTEEVSPTQSEVTDDGYLRQWAIYAEATSEYSDTSWNALQAVGEPDVQACGDDSYAWASEYSDGVDYLELTYATPVIPYEITVVQSYNPSQVIDITGITESGDEYIIWQGQPEVVDTCPDWMVITIEPDSEIYINRLRITVDQSVLGLGWNEIDAVELVGIPEGGIASLPSVSQENGGDSEAPYAPNELDPGSFSYSVSGYENDVIMGADIQYQTTKSAYVVGLVSGDMRYAVSLILPKEGLSTGKVVMKSYNDDVTTKGPTAAIYINTFLYAAEEGEIVFENNPNTGEITGTFYFTARSKDFPDREVEVAGSLNQVELK